jgi:hypothetical protein
MFHVYAMQAYRGSRGVAPLILNLGSRWRWVVNFTPWPLYPWEITPVPIELEARWAPWPVWSLRIRESRTPDLPAHSLVAVSIPSSLLRLPRVGIYTHTAVVIIMTAARESHARVFVWYAGEITFVYHLQWKAVEEEKQNTHWNFLATYSRSGKGILSDKWYKARKPVEELEGNLQQTNCTFASWIKSWNNIATLRFTLAWKTVKQGEPFTHGACISIFSDCTKTIQQPMYG